jgi:hypothetical protein
MPLDRQVGIEIRREDSVSGVSVGHLEDIDEDGFAPRLAGHPLHLNEAVEKITFGVPIYVLEQVVGSEAARAALLFPSRHQVAVRHLRRRRGGDDRQH